jgi:hypothetical protein
MYPATAALGTALQRLKRFSINDNELIIDAQAELEIAYGLMNNRWKIHYSIFWNYSNAKVRHTVLARMQGIAFDAKTSLVEAGSLLNAYSDRYAISDEDINNWYEIIQNLNNASRWMIRDYCDSDSKQLKLFVFEQNNKRSELW